MSGYKRLAWSMVFSLMLAGALFCTSPALGEQPATVGWRILEAAQEGTYTPGEQMGGDTRMIVELFVANQLLEKSALLIHFPFCGEDPRTLGRPVLNLDAIIAGEDVKPEYGRFEDPGPRWRLCPQDGAVLLLPGDRAQMLLTVDFLRSINQNLSPRLHGNVFSVEWELLEQAREPQEIIRRLNNERPLGTITIDLYYRLTEKNTWIAGDYASIFGEPLRDPSDGRVTDDYEQNAHILPVQVLSYRRNLPLPGEFEDDGGRRLKETLEIIKWQGSGLGGEEVCYEEDYKFHAFRQPDRRNQNVSQQAAISHVITGKFSTRWSSDHSLHPGFGFRVEAYTNENTGAWRRLASGWVQSNGTWRLEVPASAGFQGKLLRVLYRSYNSYYRPQNQDGNTYSWRDPDRTNIPTTYYVGHRYADTDGGDYNGVGELVDAAMYMWSRLYWRGGINPVPSSPIKLYFPNTWYNCSGSSPWSCANTSGEIWLIAAHGVQARVVVHEMAHQLNNKFWNNKRPAGSGGSHTLNGCYPTRLGMALREGFANFLPGWVGYPARNVAGGGFNSGRWTLSYDLESRNSPPNCTNGWENEIWAARTFWDLHDTRTDGDDILWFVHPGAVIAIYLANGVANDGDARDMRDYEQIYRNAASSGHEGYISDIFEQNRM